MSDNVRRYTARMQSLVRAVLAIVACKSGDDYKKADGAIEIEITWGDLGAAPALPAPP